MTETAKTANRTSKKNFSRANRGADRIPVSGQREILTVYGKNPDLAYRWVRSSDEEGSRIFAFHQAGWDFVQAGEVKIGQSLVYKTENVGSIIRTPSKDGGYLYLMCIPKELYDEDQARKAAEIDETERQIFAPETDEGQYGKTKQTFHIGKVGEDDNLK